MSASQQALMFGSAAAWTPAQLPSLLFWWDLSDSANVVLSGSNVSQLTDKSGNSNHATQATSGNRFVIATAQFNGLNAMQSNGTNTSFMSFPQVNLNQSLTFLAVVQANGTHNSPNVFGPSIGGVGGMGFGAFSGSPPHDHNINLEVSPTRSLVCDETANTALTWICGTVASGGLALYKKGTQIGTLTTGSAATTQYFDQIGYGGVSIYTWTGYLCELIACSAVVTSTDIANANTYFVSKWGIP